MVITARVVIPESGLVQQFDVNLLNGTVFNIGRYVYLKQF